jgi:glycine/D-amino acid oxidase-like deaminating enzyme
MLDFIIVGQGIAGSMLSWFLMKDNQQILVIDKFNPSSATHVAPGVTNPITGRKFVKTWLADELIPFANTTYNQFEELFQDTLLHPLSIIKLFDSVKAQNDWSVRSAMPGYDAYLKNEQVINLDPEKVKNDFGGFEINGSTKLDASKFLIHYRRLLQQKELLLDESFNFEALELHDGFVVYQGKKARRIIFCEGANAINNPYFKFLPFQLAKGECLVLKIDDFYADRVISGEVGILPTFINKDEYFMGATHEWHFDDDLPSEKGKNELLGNLSTVLNAPYQILQHRSAIRPTVKDRRPFLGFHPEYKNVGIFNGMGTKGLSLAPFFARHFMQHLVNGTPLMKEVDIKRVLKHA